MTEDFDYLTPEIQALCALTGVTIEYYGVAEYPLWHAACRVDHDEVFWIYKARIPDPGWELELRENDRSMLTNHKTFKSALINGLKYK